MKFKVGDFLVDAGHNLLDKQMSATVIDLIDDCTGRYYRLQYHQGFDDWLEAEEVEYKWELAPTGSVGWLINELSKHDPLEKVFYADDSLHWELITDVEERYGGGVSVC